jgi:hypothetical protein
MKLVLSVIVIAVLVSASEAKTVRVAVPSQSMAQIALHAGQDNGYYREEGGTGHGRLGPDDALVDMDGKDDSC